MPRRFRKSRKLRGSRTYGWGIQGQHRRGGMRGGRGKAGIHAQKWAPPAPKYAGKKGFKSLRREEGRIVNIGDLEDLIARLPGRAIRGRMKIDLSKLGYDKLLGRGEISRPVSVIIKSFSESAKRKLEEAGGEIVEAD